MRSFLLFIIRPTCPGFTLALFQVRIVVSLVSCFLLLPRERTVFLGGRCGFSTLLAIFLSHNAFLAAGIRNSFPDITAYLAWSLQRQICQFARLLLLCDSAKTAALQGHAFLPTRAGIASRRSAVRKMQIRAFRSSHEKLPIFQKEQVALHGPDPHPAWGHALSLLILMLMLILISPSTVRLRLRVRMEAVKPKAFRSSRALSQRWFEVVRSHRSASCAMECAGFARDHVAMNVREMFLHWITRVCAAGRIFALRAACFGLRERFLRCGHSVYGAGSVSQSIASAINLSHLRSIRRQLRLNRNLDVFALRLCIKLPSASVSRGAVLRRELTSELSWRRLRVGSKP